MTSPRGDYCAARSSASATGSLDLPARLLQIFAQGKRELVRPRFGMAAQSSIAKPRRSRRAVYGQDADAEQELHPHPAGGELGLLNKAQGASPYAPPLRTGGHAPSTFRRPFFGCHPVPQTS